MICIYVFAINFRTLGDGLITESEFMNWLSKIKTHKDNDIEEDLKAAFSVFDIDKNGRSLNSKLDSHTYVNIRFPFIRIYNERRTEVSDATDGRKYFRQRFRRTAGRDGHRQGRQNQLRRVHQNAYVKCPIDPHCVYN